ncbi:MAG: dTDP-glucose 4,6-dehydratase [Acidobacteria bacterium]|nr:dTDP-glucose 4,6-dehydratase [Acidobacteriota bacterium]MCA1611705.1 dTDP-glucose 4,6-dehydratase [Acidobacteriota bacterium]
MKLLVTGGSGFIGSNFIRQILESRGDGVRVVNLDKLTYAANPANLADVDQRPNYQFIHGDITDPEAVRTAMEGCTDVVNFAAETHVDRSLLGDASFIETDVRGVFVLLEEARKRGVRRFIQISTDEVYGTIAEGSFTEESPLNPRNPYSASKAGGDRLAYSYWASYGVPVVITRASNNYGPYQYPEKLIPLFVTNAIDDQPLPLYGDGRNVRDWLYVRDHAAAIDFLLDAGEPGEVYNIAGGNEAENIEITRQVLRELKKPESLIRFVNDRPGHDRRYSLDASKLARLGFASRTAFQSGLSETVAWYRNREDWWRPVKEKDAAYREYYRTQYGDRLATSSATAKEPAGRR